MRETTLTELQRLAAQVDAADVVFLMDENAFRGFYDRTARALGVSLACDGRPANGRRLAAALIGVVAWWVWQRADWLTSVPIFQAFDAMGFAVRGVLLAIGLWLVLAPAAVYLVASDDP